MVCLMKTKELVMIEPLAGLPNGRKQTPQDMLDFYVKRAELRAVDMWKELAAMGPEVARREILRAGGKEKANGST